MYAKLTLRNAKRSVGDYLLYVTTMIVLSAIMMFSNSLSVVSGQSGLQAGSVPAMISLVMIALFNYINGYMLRRRAKEFATYIMLGMNKRRMAFVFFGESLILGIAALAVGMLFGSLSFQLALSILNTWFSVEGNALSAFGVAAKDTVLYFSTVQLVSLIGCVLKINKMQINSLMSENRKNQQLKASPRPVLWTVFCFVCLIAVTVLILLITCGDAILMMVGVNFIIFPLLLGTWAFYKAVFHGLSWLRLYRKSVLYQGNLLYFAARLLSKITSNITLNTVLSICLLFSVMTFSVGVIMPNMPDTMMRQEMAVWMSFAEICLCVVFIVIYFSILAVHHVVETKENRHSYSIVAFLGKTDKQCRKIVFEEIIIKYTLPTIMCLLLIALCAVPVNQFLNSILQTKNLLGIAMGIFAVCFSILYVCYAFVVYKMSIKHLDLSRNGT
jgi:hypothetical protein